MTESAHCGAVMSDDSTPPIPATLGGRYTILREVGRGGMGLVYLAHDTKHARDVAVKVIRLQLAETLPRARFLREIGIAARLRHPNIVPLYDSGDADGVLYFVMPFEEGLSLRQRLDEAEPVPISEAVNILRDVARALTYAHEHGVMHRDVKPDNVMLSGSAAVVTDFGIAKAISTAQGDGAGTTLTQAGAGVGTPAYVAPEQAVGDPTTDHRADIYSFGCVAYEVFAGHPPFHNLSTHQLIAAHMSTKPPPVTLGRPDVPAPIARLIAQCLEKDPHQRPQTARELLATLDDGVADPHVPFGWRGQRVRRAVALAITVAAVMGGTYAISKGLGRTSSAAPRSTTVAVLPLLSVGGDSLQRELADGLSDEVASALVGSPGITVMSRRGVGKYRDQHDIDFARTGEELGARFLVHGTLRDVDGRLRVLATLVDSKGGAAIWSKQFDRDKRDLEAVRDEIARAVSDALRRTAGFTGRVTTQQRLARRTLNPDAYRLYVLAQRALSLRGAGRLRYSVEMFRQATQLDSNYADAFSGLSVALALLPIVTSTPASTVAPDVRRAAERALRLDTALALPHVALGMVYQDQYAWDSAETEFRSALRLRTADDIEPLIQYGRHLNLRGRHKEALEQFRLAQAADPASTAVLSNLAYSYYLDGQLDSALAESARALESDSTNGRTIATYSVVRLKIGQTAGLRDLVIGNGDLRLIAFYLVGALGDTATVMSQLRKFEAQKSGSAFVATTRAFAMLGVGDTAQALRALEQAVEFREPWPTVNAPTDPVFSSLWPTARFQALMRRIGLGDVRLPPDTTRR